MVPTGTNNLRKWNKSQLQFCCTHNVNLFISISVLLSHLLSINDDDNDDNDGDDDDNDDDDDDDDDGCDDDDDDELKDRRHFEERRTNNGHRREPEGGLTIAALDKM
ncbi:unnamed protein product [Acanthocheilonema viteae]|uniref:Uncharacterized protein n=1 Tax=Acanthocheilonema viteae TaxID=6277 RepID=A0A498SH92_ACAVI|nr:unnamed protein product [Acanthocheilonema viteae]